MRSIREITEEILEEELRGLPLEYYLKDKERHEDLRVRIGKRLEDMEAQLTKYISGK